MSAESFQVGDVVVLKSGSPKMTVVEVEFVPMGIGVKCMWFDKSDRKEAVFTPFALKLYENPINSF